MSISTRLITLEDVPTLVDLMRANRAFLAPWEPRRADEFFTVSHQADAVADLLEQHHRGTVLPHVIIGADGTVIGRVTLNNIVRGPLQSAKIGAWVAASEGGRGVASAALTAMIPVAFGRLGLHRLAAATLLHNVRAQRVLEKAGFYRIGVAPRYLQIGGEYRDHALYQLLADDPGAAA